MSTRPSSRYLWVTAHAPQPCSSLFFDFEKNVTPTPSGSISTEPA
jgi:hypothetical protein